MLLSPDQIIELTGYQRPSKQVAALRQMGVRHFVRLDGRPVVDESALSQPAPTGAGGPDWSALNAND